MTRFRSIRLNARALALTASAFAVVGVAISGGVALADTNSIAARDTVNCATGPGVQLLDQHTLTHVTPTGSANIATIRTYGTKTTVSTSKLSGTHYCVVTTKAPGADQLTSYGKPVQFITSMQATYNGKVFSTRSMTAAGHSNPISVNTSFCVVPRLSVVFADGATEKYEAAKPACGSSSRQITTLPAPKGYDLSGPVAFVDTATACPGMPAKPTFTRNILSGMSSGPVVGQIRIYSKPVEAATAASPAVADPTRSVAGNVYCSVVTPRIGIEQLSTFATSYIVGEPGVWRPTSGVTASGVTKPITFTTSKCMVTRGVIVSPNGFGSLSNGDVQFCGK